METGLILKYARAGWSFEVSQFGRQNSKWCLYHDCFWGNTGLRWSATLSTLHWQVCNTDYPHLLSVFFFLAQCPWRLISMYCATWAFLSSGVQLGYTNKRDQQQKIQGQEEREVGVIIPLVLSLPLRGSWILSRPLSTAPPGHRLHYTLPPSMPPLLPHSLLCSFRPRAAFQTC